MISARTDDLLTIPRNIGRSIIDAGTVIACPLLGTDKFVRFCKERGLSISRERLIGLERLRLFAPVFRVLTPEQDVPHLSIPPGNDTDWFNEGWAWDTTGVKGDEWGQVRSWVVAPGFSVSQFPPMTDYLNISETEPLLETLAMNGGRCFFMNLAMAGSALTKICAISSP
jgi:hypothetical protein